MKVASRFHTILVCIAPQYFEAKLCFSFSTILILSCQRVALNHLQKITTPSKLQLEAKLIYEKVTIYNTHSLIWIANQFCRMQIILVDAGRARIAISEIKLKEKFE